jgi:hypothetical protein
MSNGTPAERIAMLAQLRSALDDTEAFYQGMAVPADADDRMNGLRDDLNSLTKRVAALEADTQRKGGQDEQ